jgi:hypothetical protein
VSAYKLVASLVQDWHLQGELEIVDGVKFYSFSTTTCFGASSSADVFHDLGSAAEFILRMAVATVVICRYADDYIVFIPPRGGAPDHAHAERARARIISVCDALGLPIAKFEGPAPELVFIGSGIDTVRMRVFVPRERVDYTSRLLRAWLRKQFAKEHEILSLAGQLSFISRVIRWGRPHIADLFALARKSASRGARHIRLPASLRVSIQWWIDALAASPWVSIREFAPFHPTVVFETDASMDGIGAYSPTTRAWFSYRLSQAEIASALRRKSRCMGELELRAIAMALVTFAPNLAGASLLCITDNHESEVAVNKRSSRMPKIRHDQDGTHASEILIHRSKTDKLFKGVWVTVPHNGVETSAHQALLDAYASRARKDLHGGRRPSLPGLLQPSGAQGLRHQTPPANSAVGRL